MVDLNPSLGVGKQMSQSTEQIGRISLSHQPKIAQLTERSVCSYMQTGIQQHFYSQSTFTLHTPFTQTRESLVRTLRDLRVT